MKAVAHLRAGKGPFLLNLRTCRWEPHCGIIKDTRDQEMIGQWKKFHDPLNVLAERYPGKLTRSAIEEIENSIDQRIGDAVEQALKSPAPSLEEYKNNFGV